jgi:hypothetical protein
MGKGNKMTETLLSPSNVLLFGRVVEDLQIVHTHDHNPFVEGRKTANNLLGQQVLHQKTVAGDRARFARIYGFSFEGTYYDLPRPVLFLVHGPGVPAETVADVRPEPPETPPPPAPPPPPHPAQRVARSPDDPSRTGVAAPDFSFSDGLMVWSYDKADYTIRMDVETGMFEQVLLDACFGDGWDGPMVSGGRVSGGRVSGGRVAGGRVSGGRVSGGRVSGGRVGGPRGRGDPSD